MNAIASTIQRSGMTLRSLVQYLATFPETAGPNKTTRYAHLHTGLGEVEVRTSRDGVKVCIRRTDGWLLTRPLDFVLGKFQTALHAIVGSPLHATDHGITHVAIESDGTGVHFAANRGMTRGTPVGSPLVLPKLPEAYISLTFTIFANDLSGVDIKDLLSPLLACSFVLRRAVGCASEYTCSSTGGKPAESDCGCFREDIILLCDVEDTRAAFKSAVAPSDCCDLP